MVLLHTHTVFSDGNLTPSALVRQAQALGYRTVVLTDHADWMTYAWILDQQVQGRSPCTLGSGVELCIGLELTHVPPAVMADLADSARERGARILLAHGETLAESVQTGTNLAAIEAGVDILAHPGLIQPEEAALAAERGVLLEISCRAGHCLANGHVLAMARKYGAGLVLGTDLHTSRDLITKAQRQRIAFGAGMSQEEFFQAEQTAQRLVEKARKRDLQ